MNTIKNTSVTTVKHDTTNKDLQKNNNTSGGSAASTSAAKHGSDSLSSNEIKQHNIKSQCSNEEVLNKINHLINVYSGSHKERLVLDFLKKLSNVQLNFLCNNFNLNELFASVGNKLVGPDNKAVLLELLTRNRIDALDVFARHKIIDTLQIGMTDHLAEQAVANIFLSTHDKALTALKNMVDRGNNHQDLHKLIYHDVNDDNTRQNILSHFAVEASSKSRDEFKVLSDIDDTFYSSLKDSRYPSKTVYPGVLQFYKELDCVSENDQEARSGDLVFLTARPGLAGVVENYTHASLKKMGIDNSSILTGNLKGLFTHKEMANKKVQNFNEFKNLFPEYNYLFIGDSGQADTAVANNMIDNHPNMVRGTFIHAVTNVDQEQRDLHLQNKICIFDTYVQAAVQAHKWGLIGTEALRRMCAKSQEDFQKINFHDQSKKNLVAELIDRDIMEASKLFD